MSTEKRFGIFNLNWILRNAVLLFFSCILLIGRYHILLNISISNQVWETHADVDRQTPSVLSLNNIFFFQTLESFNKLSVSKISRCHRSECIYGLTVDRDREKSNLYELVNRNYVMYQRTNTISIDTNTNGSARYPKPEKQIKQLVIKFQRLLFLHVLENLLYPFQLRLNYILHSSFSFLKFYVGQELM